MSVSQDMMALHASAQSVQATVTDEDDVLVRIIWLNSQGETTACLGMQIKRCQIMHSHIVCDEL